MQNRSCFTCLVKFITAPHRLRVSGLSQSRTLAAVFFLAAFGFSVQAQRIDQNHNGMSDVWELLYGTSGSDPMADSDGDGFSNLQEALAGTNPFDSNSYPRIAFFGATNSSFSATIAGTPGKVYQLQSISALGETNWVVETGMVLRAGSSVTLTAPADLSAKFFRIGIADTNSDGSSMNDWEKYQLGLDPLNPFSNGNVDNNGQLLSDYTYATNQLASQSVFSIAATDPLTTQPDPGASPTDLGMMTVTRGGFPLTSMTVNLGLGGPGPGFAAEGVDHTPVSRSVTMPAGVSSVTIPITPLANTNLHAPVVVQAQLRDGDGYTVGSSSNASVVIYPSPTAKGTGLLGYYFTNSSANYTNVANFNHTNLFLTRLDPTVDFVWGGTNPAPNLSNGLYSVRWVGQIQPEYSETYRFDVRSDDGCKLWVATSW